MTVFSKKKTLSQKQSGNSTVSVPFVTPEDYGAIGNGSTDDSAAIQLAVDSGYMVIFGSKNYRVNSAISLNGNVSVIGGGALSIISTTSDISIFSIVGRDNSISNISFLGNSTGTSQFGISAVGNAGFTLYYLNNIISECRFNNLGGAGIYGINIFGSSAGQNHEGIYRINSCIFSGCNYGINLSTRAEYSDIVNCSVQNCTIGVSLAGGNNGLIGSQITNCGTGLQILSSSNNAHAPVSGVKINHNTINLSASNTIVQIYSGCNFFSGGITLTGTGNSLFEGCSFSLQTYTLTITKSPTSFSNCIFHTSPTTFTLTGTQPKMIDCYMISGAKMVYPTRSYIEKNIFASNGTFIIPTECSIESITIYNKDANAVSGGVRIGTSAGGSDIVIAQSVTSNGVLVINDSDLLKKILSVSSDTTVYIEAVTSWNSASLTMLIKLKQNIF